MPFDPLESYHIADDLRRCIEAQLRLVPDGFPAGFSSCVSWGNHTWDNCCPGMLRVGFARAVPTSRFPNPDITPNLCGSTEKATDFRITLLRCAPMPNQDGDPPSCAEQDAHARLMSQLEDAVWRSIRCCFGDDPDLNWIIRESVPLGPRGGCSGFQVTVAVGLMNPCFCGDGTQLTDLIDAGSGTTLPADIVDAGSGNTLPGDIFDGGSGP